MKARSGGRGNEPSATTQVPLSDPGYRGVQLRAGQLAGPHSRDKLAYLVFLRVKMIL